MRRRVVITGLGPVSPIGTGVEAFWSALESGATGLSRIERFDPSGFPCRLAGEVRGVDVREFVPKPYRKATKVMARDIELAVVSARLAAEDAGLKTRGSDEGAEGFAIRPERTGCQIGAGLIAAETDELSRAAATAKGADGRFSTAMWGTEGGGAGGMNNLPPLWLLKYLPNMLACHVTIIHGAEGPSNTITCAEASALLSIGEGCRVIERGDADLCFSGGAESKVNLMGHLRLTVAKRLAETGAESDGSRLVKPYDPASAGGVSGEAGGILMIEEAGHARGRGARVYCEVSGFGAAQSPVPIFPGLFDAPRAPGAGDPGMEHAVRGAIKDAGCPAEEIDAIVPLAIGVPELDAAEAGALRAVFGARLAEIPLITLTPAVGNGMAGFGGLAVAAGALALDRQRLPARVHAGRPEGVDAGAAPARDAALRRVLVCVGGLGGQNAAVVLSRADG
jgi:3-oxoacyl-[acyl-carrier-protein] synthase II